MRTFAIGLVILSLALAVSAPTFSQDKPVDKSMDKPADKSANQTQPPSPEAMKRWLEATTPGEPHRLLDHFIGSFTTTTKFWMAGAGTTPTETTGTSEVKWVLDGHWVLGENTGLMMGRPVAGMGLTGYDNIRKRYVFSWVDSTSTALFTAEGTYDPATRALTYEGLMDDPMTGERDKKVRYVHRIIDADTSVFEIHTYAPANGGQPSKVVEITYRRK